MAMRIVEQGPAILVRCLLNGCSLMWVPRKFSPNSTLLLLKSFLPSFPIPIQPFMKLLPKSQLLRSVRSPVLLCSESCWQTNNDLPIILPVMDGNLLCSTFRRQLVYPFKICCALPCSKSNHCVIRISPAYQLPPVSTYHVNIPFQEQG